MNTEKTSPIDNLLKPWDPFGVRLGLAPNYQLLANLDNPHQKVLIIHVAGTNGKGSVCAYLSAILTAAGYRVGRYTSPHLINWNERICINDEPITNEELISLISCVIDLIDPGQIPPTKFEIVTAAAWLYFAEKKVDIAIMEVGLGGRLDATNVRDKALVSIITSIGLDHTKILGNTLGEIAREKAGILKLKCPAVIGPVPPEASTIIGEYVQKLQCPAVWVKPAREIQPGWGEYDNIKYPLPLLGEFQLSNSAVAIAAIQILQKQGWNITNNAIEQGMAQTKWPGRLQWTNWRDYPLLIDGAHNSSGAEVLRQFVDNLNKKISWVIGILKTKDYGKILEILLKNGDRVYLVPVPDPLTTNPAELAKIAQELYPNLDSCQAHPDLTTGLDIAMTEKDDRIVVLCGSLYLIGHFLEIKSVL